MAHDPQFDDPRFDRAVCLFLLTVWVIGLICYGIFGGNG